MRRCRQPDWQWSKHIKPIAGTDSCMAAHAGRLDVWPELVLDVVGLARRHTSSGKGYLPASATSSREGHARDRG